MKIQIREYRPSDHDELAALYAGILQKEFTWRPQRDISVADFDSAVQGERILVAEADGRIAGFLSVFEPDAFIHSLYVDACCRHAGIGRALLAEAESEFGLPLTLKCEAGNRAALRFYTAAGWKNEQEGMSEEGPYYLMSLRR